MLTIVSQLQERGLKEIETASESGALKRETPGEGQFEGIRSIAEQVE